MKRSRIYVGILISMISVGLISLLLVTSKLHRPIKISNAQSITIWSHTNWEFTSRVVNNEEEQKIVTWFNSITDIRNNKYFAGITPSAGIIIKLKNGKEIAIINSGADFEVQSDNYFGKRISYWGKQKDIKNLLDEASKNKQK